MLFLLISLSYFYILQRHAAELSITSFTSAESSKRPNSGLQSSYRSPTRRFSKSTNSGGLDPASAERGSRERISGLSFVSAKSRVTMTGDANSGTIWFSVNGILFL